MEKSRKQKKRLRKKIRKFHKFFITNPNPVEYNELDELDLKYPLIIIDNFIKIDDETDTENSYKPIDSITEIIYEKLD